MLIIDTPKCSSALSSPAIFEKDKSSGVEANSLQKPYAVGRKVSFKKKHCHCDCQSSTKSSCSHNKYRPKMSWLSGNVN